MALTEKIKKVRHRLYLNRFHHLPLQPNKIMFWTMGFKSYGCSPKYITEYLRTQYPGQYDLVWVFTTERDLPDNLPSGVRAVRYFSIDYLREISTAKFIICNTRTGPFHYFNKRKGQVYIQTWHSSLRLKMIEGDAADTLPDHYIAAAKEDSQKIDLLLAGCGFSEKIFRRAFWYDGEILCGGTPRCDILFYNGTDIRSNVLNYYKIPEETRFVLYAPTFRDNKEAQTHGLDFYALRAALEQKTNSPWIVGCRFHPGIPISGVPDGAIAMTDYPDMQELLAAADCLITDYSSCMFDMALTKKPCILFVPDLEEYTARERGLYFDIEELPFPAAHSMSQLLSVIKLFDLNQYQTKVLEFIQSIDSYEDGNAAKRVAEYIRKSGETL